MAEPHRNVQLKPTRLARLRARLPLAGLGLIAGHGVGATTTNAASTNATTATNATISTAAAPSNTGGAQDTGGFVFTVIGDTPYSRLEELALQRLLAAQDDRIAFVMHLGDIKSGWERCSDELLRHRASLLMSSRRPLVFVPGDNEWVDCSRFLAGGFDPLDRMALLRRLFFSASREGPDVLPGIVRQSHLDAQHPFPEHSRWIHRGVCFITVNLPGSHNARSSTPQLHHDQRARMSAIRAWMTESFHWAIEAKARAIVIGSHANPQFSLDRPDRPPVAADDPDDAYAAWRWLLREQAALRAWPILLLHGDTHSFQYDQPLRDHRGRTIRNLFRLECFGTPRSSAFVTVGVPPGAFSRFLIRAQELPPAPLPAAPPSSH